MHTGMFFNVIVDERLGLQHRLYHLRGPHRGKCARTHVCSSALENQEQNAKQIRNIPADSCLVSWTKSAGPGKPCCEVESQQAHQNNYIKKCHAKKMLTCRHRLCLCPCAPRAPLLITLMRNQFRAWTLNPGGITNEVSGGLRTSSAKGFVRRIIGNAVNLW